MKEVVGEKKKETKGKELPEKSEKGEGRWINIEIRKGKRNLRERLK